MLIAIYYFYNHAPDLNIYRKILFSEKTMLTQLANVIAENFSLSYQHISSYTFWQEDQEKKRLWSLDSERLNQMTLVKKMSFHLDNLFKEQKNMHLMINHHLPHSFYIEFLEYKTTKKNLPIVVEEGKDIPISLDRCY